MFKFVYWTVFSLATLMLINDSEGTIQVITGLIQRNVLGIPLLHQEQKWPIDPEAGIRSAPEYQRLNGIRGEKDIEKLGLGIDGNQQRRLLEQRQRDEGHLGGLNFYRP